MKNDGRQLPPNVDIADLKAQGLSDEEIEEVIEQEAEWEADRRMEEIEKSEKALEQRIVKQRQEQQIEIVQTMQNEQFAGSEIGHMVINFVDEVIKGCEEIELSPFLKNEDRIASVFEAGDKCAEISFSDRDCNLGFFYFDYGSLYREGDEIKIDMRMAFIKNVRYWAKKTRSLTYLNGIGSSHTNALAHSTFWLTDEGSARVQKRLQKYITFSRERFYFESIIEKMTPSLFLRVVNTLSQDEAYKELIQNKIKG